MPMIGISVGDVVDGGDHGEHGDHADDFHRNGHHVDEGQRLSGAAWHHYRLILTFAYVKYGKVGFLDSVEHLL